MRPSLRFLIHLIAVSIPGYAVAQESEQACTSYQECALRIEYAQGLFRGPSLVRGITSVEVAGGLGSESVRTLFELDDNAWPHYEDYLRDSRRAGAWEWSALAFVGVGTVLSARNSISDGWYIGFGVGFLASTFVSSSYRRGSWDSLSQAIWWYNAALEP